MRKPIVIYMCYDGILEPLGESQVVAYLEKLADEYKIHLISFEKRVAFDEPAAMTAMRARLKAVGTSWHPRRYHKRPEILSTLWDMARAMVLATWLSLRHEVSLLHARSILCAAMLFPARFIVGAKFVVDIRGFWADERVDGGMIRPNGIVYRVLKTIERAMLRRADHIVTLTQASVPYLREDIRLGAPTSPITVIPTCADLELFSPADAAQAGPPTIGYVGQIGTWYMLEEMLALFSAVYRRRPDFRLLLVNKNQQADIRAGLRVAGIDQDAVELVSAAREDVPAQIRRMDAGMALIRPCFSKIASAPTKLAEYLGCGVPVVGNVGCGDMAKIIADDRVGIAMADTDPATIEAAAQTLIDNLADVALKRRCVASARRRFSLEDGVARYRAIYRSLLPQIN